MKALAEALEDSEVNELDLTENGVRIVIRRQRPQAAGHGGGGGGGRRAPTGGSRSRGSASRTNAASAPNPGVAVVAPLTGVYYASPSPSSAAFVQMGEVIQAGQIVCIIEAMKVFNEIKSEVAGTVIAMPAKNGQLVQKGDALIRVNPL